MNKIHQYDVAIIGAGPGGYTSAIRGAQLGLKVIIIEKKHYGGTCLNWGCIPAKALLRSAEQYYTIKHKAQELGLKVKDVSFNLDKIIKRSRCIVDKMNKGIQNLFKKYNIDVIDGIAEIKSKNLINITLNTQIVLEIKASNIIIATGARARIIPGIEPDGKFIWTYKQALVPDIIPKRLLIIGSGAIGIEFASFFNSFGSNVSIVEIMDDILPTEDKDISKYALKSFKKLGMNIFTSTKVNKIIKNKDNITAVIILKNGKIKEYIYDRVILAVGIVGNIENIGLKNLGIKSNNSHIIVNQWSKTNIDNIYAIGDVAGPPWLAHKASHEGIVCIEKIAKQKNVFPIDSMKIASCTYCYPQIASIGFTEENARIKGYNIRVGKFPFIVNGKAASLNETDGFIKTIFDKKTGELLGAHMIGPEVTEIIQGISIAKQFETTEHELMHTIFPHPTLSETLHESVLDAYNRAIHI